MKKIAIISGIIIIVAAIGFRLVQNKKKIDAHNKPVDRTSIPVPVTVTTLEIGKLEGNFSLPAVVKPNEEVNLTFSASGKLKQLNLELGSQVVKGQFLGVLDVSLKQISLENAQLMLNKTKADYERIKQLYEGKAATEVDYINAKYAFENAANQVAQIKQQIADASLISPVSGMVIQKNIDEGEFVNTGAVVATVVDVNKLKANVMVSEGDVYKLKVGMSSTITAEVLDNTIMNGKIKYISPVGDDAHNYLVEVDFINNSRNPVKAGTYITVKFNVQNNREVLLMPKIALVEGTKNPFVYVIEDGKPVVRKITVGRDMGENIEVISGLSAGSQVITSGQINITTESKVEIVNHK